MSRPAPLEISTHPFIRHFSADQATKLVNSSRLASYRDNALIFEEESPSDSICLVLAGGVILTKKTSGGSAQVIAQKIPGDYFGELGVLDGSPRSTAAFASGPTVLGHIPGPKFRELLSEVSGQTVLQLFSQISENLRSTNARYVTEVVRKEKLTLIGEMANSMIHDFRSPFTTIRLTAESLALQHEDKRTKQLAITILRQVDRLSGMVEEVLEFARGETRLQIKPVLVEQIFSELRENNPTDAFSSTKLVVRSSAIIAELDRARFQRVLQNLVTNANEALAMKRNGRIVLSARRTKDRWTLSVADNGPGIPRAVRTTLFEPFVSHGKSGGTGLGLALVKAVVEAHRGSVTYKTSRRGTTFLISLPLKQ